MLAFAGMVKDFGVELTCCANAAGEKYQYLSCHIAVFVLEECAYPTLL